MSTVSQTHCAGCGAVVTGRYCAGCGEQTEPHDYSIKHFVEEVLELCLTIYRFILFFTTFYAT